MAQEKINRVIQCFWNRARPGIERDGPELSLGEMVQYGVDAGRGNLVGIQPFMMPWDYASEQAFAAKIDGYLEACRERGWLTPKTVVALPEYLGTWLVVAGEKSAVYKATTIRGAIKTMVLSHPVAFAKEVAFARARDRVTYSVFKMKAESMVGIYHRVFSALASKYRVAIVAGSILLPSPRLEGNRLTVSDGPLNNVTVVYSPDGRPYLPLAIKAFPTAVELPFVAPGSRTPSVYPTPAGRLGVLICADSWFPEPYEELKRANAEMIVVPSHISPDGALTATWQGTSGWPTPGDVDPRDIGHLSERAAWLRYALMGRVRRTPARQAMVIPLRGQLWDVGSDGAIDLFREGKVWEHQNTARARIVNSWL